MSLFRKSWRQPQPGNLRTVDWTNPLTKGLGFLCAPGMGGSYGTWTAGEGPKATIPNLGSQVSYSDSRYSSYLDMTTCKRVAIPYGMALYGTGQYNCPCSWPYHYTWTDNRNAYTIMWFGQHTTSNISAHNLLLVGDEGATTGGNPYDQRTLQVNQGSGGSYSAGTLRLAEYHGSYFIDVTSTSPQNDGNPHVFMVTRDSGTVVMYRDGVSCPVTYNSITSISYTMTPGVTFGAPVGINSPDYSLMGAVWNRPLTQGEAEFLGANPWSLWKGKRRVIYSFPSSAITTVLGPKVFFWAVPF